MRGVLPHRYARDPVGNEASKSVSTVVDLTAPDVRNVDVFATDAGHAPVAGYVRDADKVTVEWTAMDAVSTSLTYVVLAALGPWLTSDDVLSVCGSMVAGIRCGSAQRPSATRQQRQLA